MLPLDPWNKVMVVAGAAAAVAVTIFMVVCFLGDGCLVHELLSDTKRKEKTARRLSGALYGTADKAGAALTSYGRRDVVHLAGTRQPSLASQHTTVSEKSEASLMARLTRARADSTYSSMSSGRTSPALSSTSVSPSPPSRPTITFSLLASLLPDSPVAKLAIAVECCAELPGREYGAHCDPWVSVTVWREKSSLRRRPPAALATFRTKTIRHAHNPCFGQTFVTDLVRQDLKEISLVLTVMDEDRHCGPQELGSAAISLKEARQAGAGDCPVKFTATRPLVVGRRAAGEILLGLSFLPTAQRLSFSLVRANIKRQQDTINPYVRIMMFNQAGRLVKKKKTIVQEDTKDPVFNETLNFEMTAAQLETARFLVAVFTRQRGQTRMEEVEEQTGLQEGEDMEQSAEQNNRRDSTGRGRDPCLGRVSLGRSVACGLGREHYRSVLETPRQVFSMNHTLA